MWVGLIEREGAEGDDSIFLRAESQNGCTSKCLNLNENRVLSLRSPHGSISLRLFVRVEFLPLPIVRSIIMIEVVKLLHPRLVERRLRCRGR